MTIKRGEKQTTHFIEVMGCPGGCVNGGGQPIVPARDAQLDSDPRVLRAKALYDEDEAKTLRKSHENPAMQAALRGVTSASPTATRRMSCCIPTMWIAPASKV